MSKDTEVGKDGNMIETDWKTKHSKADPYGSYSVPCIVLGTSQILTY